MEEYSENSKKKDFEYFKTINVSFFEKHGHNFLAIKNQKVIDFNASIETLINNMTAQGFPAGTYLIQDCKGTEADYTNIIMKLVVNV